MRHLSERADNAHYVSSLCVQVFHIHSEVDLGGVTLIIVDRLDGWAARPGLLQVWVDEVQTTLQAASNPGGFSGHPSDTLLRGSASRVGGRERSRVPNPTINEAMTGFALGLA